MAYRNTTLRLGPLSAAVGVDSALDDENAGLMSVCTHPGKKGSIPGPTGIRRKDYCETCGNEEKSTFVKGRKVGGAVTLIDPAALASLVDADAAKSIQVTVHPAAELVGAMPSGKSYYLSPQKGTENDYALLARLIAETPDLAYVAEYAFSATAPAWLFQLIAVDGVLTMRQMARPELVRARPVFSGTANEEWLEMAKTWAAKMAIAYDPAAYRSKRAEALARLVEEATPVPLANAQTPTAGAGVDVGAQLRAALTEMGALPSPTPARPTRRRAAAKTAAAAVAAVPEQSPAKPARRRTTKKAAPAA